MLCERHAPDDLAYPLNFILLRQESFAITFDELNQALFKRVLQTRDVADADDFFKGIHA